MNKETIRLKKLVKEFEGKCMGQDKYEPVSLDILIEFLRNNQFDIQLSNIEVRGKRKKQIVNGLPMITDKFYIPKLELEIKVRGEHVLGWDFYIEEVK